MEELTVWYCMMAEEYPFENQNDMIRSIRKCIFSRIHDFKEVFAVQSANAFISKPIYYKEGVFPEKETGGFAGAVPYENLILTCGHLMDNIDSQDQKHLLILMAADWNSNGSDYAQGTEKVMQRLEKLKNDYHGRLRIACVFDNNHRTSSSFRTYLEAFKLCDYMGLDALKAAELSFL